MDSRSPARREGRRRARPANRAQNSALGEWIKAMRTEQGISQRELADRAGLSRSYLCDIEHGRSSKPSFECLDSIAGALGADRTEMLQVAGILEPARAPEENARERKLIGVYRSLNESNQQAIESYARFLLGEEQHWVQVTLAESETQRDGDRPRLQSGPTLFDGLDV